MNFEPAWWNTNHCTIILSNLRSSLMHVSQVSKSTFKPMACKENANHCNHTCVPAKVSCATLLQWFKIGKSKRNLGLRCVFIPALCYLVWGNFPLVSHHPPQAGHRAKQRHSQPDPQVPLSFGAEHQNHTQRPATDEDTQSGTVGNRTAFSLISVPFLAQPPLRPGRDKRRLSWINQYILTLIIDH